MTGEARRPSISAILITLNEEDRIGGALESVGWVDEIVVVDAGSTDGTERVVRRYTEHFHVRPWEGFGIQKQRALELATGEWVLALDADEEVSDPLRRSIESAVADPRGCAAFDVELHTWQVGTWFGARGWWRERKRRLFRRDAARFRAAEVHEGIVVDGAVGRLRGPLLHHHSRDLEHHIEKMNHYTSVAARGAHARGERAGPVYALARASGQFAKSYLLRGGFLYGGAGLVVAALSSQYAFLKTAKLWEKRIQASPPEGRRA